MKKILELKQQLTSNDINKDLESAKVSLLDTSNRSTDKQANTKHPYLNSEVSQFDQSRKNHSRQRTANQSMERLRRSENSEVRLNNRTINA